MPVDSGPPAYPTREPAVGVANNKDSRLLAASLIDRSTPLEITEMPPFTVKAPTVGENPFAVTCSERIVPGAGGLLLITMSPPSVHVGEQSNPMKPGDGVMVAETSRVMIPAQAGLLSASPATMAASVVLRNVENIGTPMMVLLSGRLRS